jgi:tetratricopeptide (TPR) repeat protein
MSSANRKSEPKVFPSETLHDFDGSGGVHLTSGICKRLPRTARWYDVKSTMAIPSFPGFVMSIRSERRGTFLIFLLTCATILPAQTGNKGAVGSESLQQHYNNAQTLQQAGKLSDAAEQYRAFLADALGELAMGYSLMRDYTHAAPLFDEALTLEPGSPSLLLDYARTALALGDLAHAKTLATEFIQKYPGDRQQLAQAHQLLGRTLLKLNRNQDARKEFEAAVALDPTFPNGYDLAVACLDLGDEKCAVQIFSEMEKSFGDTPEIHMAFGRAYGDSDFQPRAVTEFKRAIEENPRLPGAHYLLAAILLATGGDESHVRDAEAELKKELLISPRDSMTYAALGKIALTRNNYPEAETYLKKAILFGPQTPDAYLYLGQMYFATNRSAEAETALRQCIRLTTDVSRNRYQVQKAHFFLGRILMQKGQQDAAHAEMEISRDLANKTLSQDKNNLAGLLDTAGSQDAQVPPAEAGATPPPSTPTAATTATPTADQLARRKVESMREQVRLPVADSYNNLGAIAATNNDYSNAVTYFKQAAVWNPPLEGLDYNWGRAAFVGSQFADAVMPLSRYVKSHPEDAGARSVLAISQFMTGNYPGCIEALAPAIGKADLAPQAEYVYAESMVRTGRIASGAERLAALEKSHPEIPDVHRALGEALAQQGEKQRAREELRTAIQLSPRDADAHYDLGKMELASGDTAAAIPELESATRLLPNSEQFHQELADAYTAALRPADAQKERETCNLLRARVQSSTSSHPSTAPEQ